MTIVYYIRVGNNERWCEMGTLNKLASLRAKAEHSIKQMELAEYSKLLHEARTFDPQHDLSTLPSYLAKKWWRRGK